MGVMTDYLTIKKIIKDSVALYRAHVLFITTLISGVLIPYSLLVKLENLPDVFILIIPIFLFLMMLVEIVSTKLAATGYVDNEFIIADEMKKGVRFVVPYFLITMLAAFASFIGLSLLVFPGVIALIFFNLYKVEYIIQGGKLKDSFLSTLKLLNDGSFIKIIKIYVLPILLQFAMALLLNIFLRPESLEEDIFRLYPYMTAGIIIVFPISICFRTAIYFNNIKYRQLKPSNELV
jgi:hypothetical protein